MAVTSIRLKPEIESALRETAERLKRSRNWLINQAVQEFLERENREEVRWNETLDALESVREGKVIEGASVHSWLEGLGSGKKIEKPSK